MQSVKVKAIITRHLKNWENCFMKEGVRKKMKGQRVKRDKYPLRKKESQMLR